MVQAVLCFPVLVKSWHRLPASLRWSRWHRCCRKLFRQKSRCWLQRPLWWDETRQAYVADGTFTICSLQWTRCNGLALVTQGAVSWQLHSLKFQAWERAYSRRPVPLYLEEATPASSCPLQKPGLLLGPDLQDVRHLLKHLVDQEPKPLPVAWASVRRQLTLAGAVRELVTQQGDGVEWHG